MVVSWLVVGYERRRGNEQTFGSCILARWHTHLVHAPIIVNMGFSSHSAAVFRKEYREKNKFWVCITSIWLEGENCFQTKVIFCVLELGLKSLKRFQLSCLR